MRRSLTSAFAKVHADFLAQKSPDDISGTAATLVAFLATRTVVIANVGDVRAVLCCDKAFSPVVLTRDHLASDPEEQKRVAAIDGGFVSFENGRYRLQGRLALTRAIGDGPLASYVSCEPHVAVFNASAPHWRFIAVATDGVFDALSNREVVALALKEMVRAEGVAVAASNHADGAEPTAGSSKSSSPWWTKAARRIVQEAAARGLTMDNMGVAVVPLPAISYSSECHAHAP